MKKFAVALLFAATAYAKSDNYVKAADLPPVTSIMPALGLESNAARYLTSGKLPDTALEFQAGSELPVRYLLRHNLLSLSYDPKLTIKVEKTCYLRFVGKKVYMSLDLVEWHKPKEFFDLEQLDVDVCIPQDSSGLIFEGKLSNYPIEEAND